MALPYDVVKDRDDILWISSLVKEVSDEFLKNTMEEVLDIFDLIHVIWIDI